MQSILIDSQHHPVLAGDKLGEGGEGAVYALKGDVRRVLKRYHRPLAAAQAAKLQAAVKQRTAALESVCAWPLDLLRDARGTVQGYLMPRVEAFRELHTLYTPGDRRVHFEHAGYDFLVQAARNLAAAVGRVHEHGLVIGDLNPRNVLVNRQALIMLIDCDSMQLQADGQTFRCPVATPHLTPPELQGANFALVDRTPQHDAFALAVLLFHLLMMGRHPYAGIHSGSGDISLEQAIAEGRYVYGSDAATRHKMSPPPNVPPLGLFGSGLAGLFERAFTAVAGARPHAADWVQALDRLRTGLRPCAHEPRHRFHATLARCPWCALEEQGAFYFAPSRERQPEVYDPDQVRRSLLQVPMPRFVEPRFNERDFVQADPRIEDLGVLRLQLWILGGLGLLLLGVLYTTRLWWLGLLLTPAHGWWCRARWRQMRRLRLQRQADLEQLEAELETELAACGPAHFRALFETQRAQLSQGQQRVEALALQYREAQEQLGQRKRELQVEAFLSAYTLRTAHLPGIPPERRIRLAAHGIDNAADAHPSRVQNIPGLDAETQTVLRLWREGLERKFHFDPAADIPRAAIEQLNASFRRQRDELIMELRASPASLKRHGESLLIEQQRRIAALQPLLTRVQQARANLR